MLGVLDEKDGAGIVDALAPIATRFHVTKSSSPRAVDVEELGDTVADRVGDEAVLRFDDLAEAVDEARGWAAESDARAVVVTGSITLVGDVIALADAEGWRR